jgi:hypothetical protein
MGTVEVSTILAMDLDSDREPPVESITKTTTSISSTTESTAFCRMAADPESMGPAYHAYSARCALVYFDRDVDVWGIRRDGGDRGLGGLGALRRATPQDKGEDKGDDPQLSGDGQDGVGVTEVFDALEHGSRPLYGAFRVLA